MKIGDYFEKHVDRLVEKLVDIGFENVKIKSYDENECYFINIDCDGLRYTRAYSFLELEYTYNVDSLFQAIESQIVNEFKLYLERGNIYDGYLGKTF
jgi:hypothetical protein